MAKKYILQGQLSIASELLNFVNNELLPGTGLSKKKFWHGLDKSAHELFLKNNQDLPHDYPSNLSVLCHVFYSIYVVYFLLHLYLRLNVLQ